MSNKLPVGDTIKTAWKNIYGVKSTIWAAVLVSIVISIVLGFVTTFFGKVIPFIGFLCSIASSIIYLLITLGIYYIGIQRAKGAPCFYKQMFTSLQTNIGLSLVGVIILQFIILLIPAIISLIGGFIHAAIAGSGIGPLISAIVFAIAIFTGIYLFLSMHLAAAYVLDKNDGPINAIKHSFNATRSYLLELFAIYFLFAIIYFLLSLPLLIGLIWGIPFGYVLYGEVYKRLAI